MSQAKFRFGKSNICAGKRRLFAKLIFYPSIIFNTGLRFDIYLELVRYFVSDAMLLHRYDLVPILAHSTDQLRR